MATVVSEDWAEPQLSDHWPGANQQLEQWTRYSELFKNGIYKYVFRNTEDCKTL